MSHPSAVSSPSWRVGLSIPSPTTDIPSAWAIAVIAPMISRSRSLPPICSTKLRSIFKDVHVQALYVGESRIAGPEVVERNPHAELRQVRQRRRRFAKLPDQGGFGDLEAELAGGDAVVVHR